MSPTDLINAFQHTTWLASIALLGMLLRAWVTDKSDFPVTLPPAWQPVITAASVGVLNAVASAQAGTATLTIVMTTAAWAASTGFLDGVLIAIFGDPTKAPKWARIIVWIYDRVEGGGGLGGSASGTAKADARSNSIVVPFVPTAPRNEMRRLVRWTSRLAFAIFAFSLAACALFSKVEPPSAVFAVCVANDAAKGDSVAVIAVDCGSDALAVIEALISSADPTVAASKAYAEAKATKAALARDGGAE